MSVHPADVQVCLPGRGCEYYVPGAGHVVNAALEIGPQVIDEFLLAVLAVLAAIGVVAAPWGRGRRFAVTGPVATAAGLLMAGGALATVPTLVSAVRPVAAVFTLSSSSCVGVALLLLAGSVPRSGRVALTVAGALQLLLLPVTVLQCLLAAPLRPVDSDAVTALGHLALVVAGAVLLVAAPRCGPLRWALLLPPAATVLTAVRLGLPFGASSWIDLLPAVALTATGSLVLVSRPAPATPRRWAAAPLAGGAAALAMTLIVLLAWPAASPGLPGAGEPAIGPVRTVTASTTLALPLDRYRQSSVDRAVVLRAENTVIRTCAARQTVAVQAADLLPPERAESSTSLLGLIDRQRAAIDGYWAPPAPESSGGAQSDQDLRVLAQCVRDARERLADDGAAQQFLGRTVADSLARTDADSRVRRLQASWSRCMQLRGFTWSTPTELAQTQTTAFPTPGDTRAASASVACEGATNLPGLRVAVLVAYQGRAIGDHGVRLASARAALLAQERTATAILHEVSAQQ